MEETNNNLTEKKPFFENWEATNTLCPTCNQITKRQRGITKQNIQNLMKFRFGMSELVVLFVIVCVILTSAAYYSDTKQCRAFVANISTDPVGFCHNIMLANQSKTARMINNTCSNETSCQTFDELFSLSKSNK